MPIPQGVVRTSRWFLAELVVVALGVLVALWVDALREEARDRVEETEVLEALLIELRDNQESVAIRVARYRRRAEAQTQLVRIARGESHVQADSLDILWRWAIRTGETNPDSGVLESTLSSGDLRLIQDRELRAAIAALPSVSANVNEVERRHNRIIEDYLRPLLRRRGALPGGIGTTDFPAGGGAAYSLGAADIEMEQLLAEASIYGGVLESVLGERAALVSYAVSRIESR